MALTKKSGRQDVIVGACDFDFDDITSGAYAAMVDVPAGAIVVGGYVAVTTLFNSGTTDKFSIGHKVGSASAVDTAYSAQSADITATGLAAAVTPSGAKFTEAGSVGVRWDGEGAAATAGVGRLIVEYVVDGRTAFSQG
jgi:hypothetical protein